MKGQMIERWLMILGFALLGAWDLRAGDCTPKTYEDYRHNKVDFPQGDCSFADVVINYYIPRDCDPTHPNFIKSEDILGPPDYTEEGYPRNGGIGAFSLGNGGWIELTFRDIVATNSGDAQPDMYVYEVGTTTESTIVSLRPADAETKAKLEAKSEIQDPRGYFELGEIHGSFSAINIDEYFSGFAAGELKFDAVRIQDKRDGCDTQNGTPGADIDAVGAISCAPQADHSVTLEDSPDPVVARNSLAYRATVENLSPGASTGVVLTLTLPEGVEISPDTSPCPVEGRLMTCALGNLEAGATAVITVVVFPEKDGTLECSAEVAGEEFDSDPANNHATVSTAVGPGAEGFIRGHCNQDDDFDISDSIVIITYLFAGGQKPHCMDACDANDDGGLNIIDPITMILFLFLDGPALPFPFPGCGLDPTADDLDCEAAPGCL